MKDQDATFDPSKPCQTRDGKKVEIRFTDGPGIYPIVGYIIDESPLGGVEEWALDGLYSIGDPYHPRDLINIPPQQIPEPPEGRTWANRANLTAEQIGISEGWRLLLVGEVIPDDYQLWFCGRWDSGCGMEGCEQRNNADTRRTKQPLPKPKKRVPLEWGDIPLGSGIRNDSIGWKWSLVTGAYNDCVYLSGVRYTLQELMRCEIARPPEYKWEPCYKEVEW